MRTVMHRKRATFFSGPLDAVIFLGLTALLWFPIIVGGIIFALFSSQLSSQFDMSKFDMGGGCNPFTIIAGLREDPGVKTGAGFLTKEVLVEDKRLGKVTDFHAAGAGEVIIAGTGGVVALSEARGPEFVTAFTGDKFHVEMVDVDSDGVMEFLDSGFSFNNTTLTDSGGNTVWSYKDIGLVGDAAAGDVDGDGKAEFVVVFIDGKGVHLLDADGVLRWESEGLVKDVVMVDTNADNRLEIVYVNMHGQIVVMDAAGKVLSRANRRFPYLSHFSLVTSPAMAARTQLLHSGCDDLAMLDLRGEVIETFPAPGANFFAVPRAAAVRFDPSGPDYLAVVVKHVNNLSVLYVYDNSGELVFHEVLADVSESIAAVSLEGGPGQSLIVGGIGVAWRYDMAAPVPGAAAASNQVF